MNWFLKKIKVSELKEYSKNPRKLTEKGLHDLKKSIIKFGIAEPLVINTDLSICGGHGRKKILEELKIELVDCYVPDKLLSEKEFEELNLRLNKNIAGEFDFEFLINNFDMETLENAGFTSQELNFNVEEIEPNEKDDEIPETKDAISQLGDIWELGKHKIICGDCTDADNIQKLLINKKIDMLFTDPPYGVDYSSKNVFLNSIDNGDRNQIPIQNDDIKNYREFFGGFLSIIPFGEYNTIYVFMSGAELHNLRLAFDDCAIKTSFSPYLIWIKNNHVLGRQDYAQKHEFIIYGWKGKHRFYGDFSTTILEFDRQIKNDLHPTMKPIELLCKFLLDGSQQKMNVYDPFLGSGSTLIACEKTNRICYGLEISPRYIDVIVLRWIKFMIENKKESEIVLKRNGEPFDYRQLL